MNQQNWEKMFLFINKPVKNQQTLEIDSGSRMVSKGMNIDNSPW